MTFKNLLIILIATAAINGCSVKNKVQDFDLVCGYFGELKATPNLADMNYEQRNQFIMKRIETDLTENTNARVAWQAISHAESSERYELFKYAADSIQDGNWHCESMKELAATTGWF